MRPTTRSSWPVAVLVLAFGMLMAGCSSTSGAPVDSRTATPSPSATHSIATFRVGGHDKTLDDPNLVVKGENRIDGDTLVGTVPASYLAVWKRFDALFPTRSRPELTDFVAIDGPKSGADGAIGLNLVDSKRQYVALDVTGEDSAKELDRTMIHEYAHLLTLRPDQEPRDDATIESCDVYAGNGCPRTKAYLRAFSSEFYPGLKGQDFDYSKHGQNLRFATGRYVTRYAATNPDEDIAEVFADWVLEPASPTGSSVVDRKLRFFDRYPEVVAIRNQIRSNLGY